MPKYKPGDKVVVRPDLTEYKLYGMHNSSVKTMATESMCKLKGKVVTISEITNGRAQAYKIQEEQEYLWTDGMFSGLGSSTEQDEFDGKCLMEFMSECTRTP